MPDCGQIPPTKTLQIVGDDESWGGKHPIKSHRTGTVRIHRFHKQKFRIIPRIGGNKRILIIDYGRGRGLEGKEDREVSIDNKKLRSANINGWL